MKTTDELIARQSNLLAHRRRVYSTHAPFGKLDHEAAGRVIAGLDFELEHIAVAIRAAGNTVTKPSAPSIQTARGAKNRADEKNMRRLCDAWLKAMGRNPQPSRAEAARRVAASLLTNENSTDESKQRKVIFAVKHFGAWGTDR